MNDGKDLQSERAMVQTPGKAGEASVHQLREMIDEAGDGFYETDTHGNFREFNASFCKVLGYSREEIQGRHFASFMDVRSARRLNEAMNRVWVSHRGFSNLIWEIKDRQGDLRIIELSAYLMKNHEGDKMGFHGMVRDVTQKFETMSALREAQRRYEREFHEGRKARKRAKNLLDFVPYPMVVFTLAGKVFYVNPAFTEVFGWTLAELIGKSIPFVPPGLKEQTVDDLRRLLRKKDDTIETKRMTKDGRILDVIIRGQVTSDAEEDGLGELFILRDVTEERRMERINETLFQISRALPQYPALPELLDYISNDVKRVLHTEGAIVGLFDQERNDFYFLGAAYEDSSAQQQIKTIRHPLENTVSGRVFRTGEPVVVNDTSKEPDYYDGVDKAIGLDTRNMVVVPLSARQRIAGVLIAINKKTGAFDDRDKRLLTMIGSTVALSIENARFSKELKEAYQEVSSLNRAKDKIIDHLSHELKTPVSILLASLKMLARKLEALPEKEWKETFERACRNLERILDIQYQVGDIMRDPEYRIYSMLSFLLDQCSDQLETLLAEKTGEGDIVHWIRERIDEEFGPRESRLDEIPLATFLKERIEVLKPKFSSRKVDIMTHLEEAPAVCIPSQVLQKVVDGLIRNAVENTPDLGKIEICVAAKGKGAELTVKDSGIGITPEDRKRIFEGFFPTQETMNYSSKRPYAFNAGGKGADLLRMKVFSERYGFHMDMESHRCRFIPQKDQICPGSINRCEHCKDTTDCYHSGGTTFRLFFPPIPEKGCEPNSVVDAIDLKTGPDPS
ncbi:MAG: PAS domain S-box protein [Deltaproteobacteria bacterium]|nr:PAS domain S-box protein [Deltaproteobacteria bacterium]